MHIGVADEQPWKSEKKKKTTNRLHESTLWGYGDVYNVDFYVNKPINGSDCSDIDHWKSKINIYISLVFVLPMDNYYFYFNNNAVYNDDDWEQFL